MQTFFVSKGARFLGIRTDKCDLVDLFQTIYGEILPIYSNNDVAGLTRFINDRLLGNPDVAKMFSHPQVPGLYRKGKQLEKQLTKSALNTPFELIASKSY